jgi:hypothetical protein
MSFSADTTIRTLSKLYLWAAQLLPDILVNTKAKNDAYRRPKAKNANKRDIFRFMTRLCKT